MKKRLVLAIFCVAFAAGFVLISRDISSKSDPESVTKRFYENWNGYEGNPLSDKIYLSSSDVTNNLKNQISGIVEGFSDGGYDPVLCAQDKPESWKIQSSFVEGDMARVVVLENFYGSLKEVEVFLKKQDGWKIERIFCPSGNGDSAAVSTDLLKQDLVGGYIRDNISSLSPEPEVLGGKYYITSVKFTETNKAVVKYEDGHRAFEADVSFNVEGNKVNITSFKIIEPAKKEPNFSKGGNLVVKNGTLELVYEEPGKPALSIKAVFASGSSCKDADGKGFDCGTFGWKNGDRVEVSGIKTNESLEISALKLISRS